ncbi:hypothetical protein QQ045_020666 [Rhodiola kirilowii]
MGFKSMFLRKKKKKAMSSSASGAETDAEVVDAVEIFTRSPSSNTETQIEELRQV